MPRLPGSRTMHSFILAFWRIADSYPGLPHSPLTLLSYDDRDREGWSSDLQGRHTFSLITGNFSIIKIYTSFSRQKGIIIEFHRKQVGIVLFKDIFAFSYYFCNTKDSVVRHPAGRSGIGF